MADLNLTISEPIAAMVTAASNVAVAVLKLAETNRETMSPAARDQADQINAQIYWDWRNLLKALHIVGDPIVWPQPPKT